MTSLEFTVRVFLILVMCVMCVMCFVAMDLCEEEDSMKGAVASMLALLVSVSVTLGMFVDCGMAATAHVLRCDEQEDER